MQTTSTDSLQWDYSCPDDALSAWIGPPQPQLTDDVVVNEHIVVRIRRDTEQPVGILVRTAAKWSGRWPGALNGEFARALLEEHGPEALKMWRELHAPEP